MDNKDKDYKGYVESIQARISQLCSNKLNK